jgi:hypothetical protein
MDENGRRQRVVWTFFLELLSIPMERHFVEKSNLHPPKNYFWHGTDSAPFSILDGRASRFGKSQKEKS